MPFSFSKFCVLASLLLLTSCNQDSRRVAATDTQTQPDWFETLTQSQKPVANPDIPPEWTEVVASTVYITAKDSEAFGSGFLIHPSGYVVTNRHVVMGEDLEYEVSFDQGEVTYQAELVSLNQCDDLALLRLKNTRGQQFPYVTFGERVRLGEEIWLAGYPGDREQVVLSQGNVAQIARKEIQELLGPVDTFAVNERLGGGSSGGPVFNGEQEVVGISYAIDPRGSFDDQYAIRADTLLASLPKMLKQKFIHGWGFEYDYAATEAIPVSRVYPESPAAELGLEPGDVITKIEGVFFREQAGERYCRAMRVEGQDREPLRVTVDRRGREYEGVVFEEPLNPTQNPTPNQLPVPEEIPDSVFEPLE